MPFWRPRCHCFQILWADAICTTRTSGAVLSKVLAKPWGDQPPAQPGKGDGYVERAYSIFFSEHLGQKSCCLQTSPTTCFFGVQYLNLRAMGISGPHFKSVAEFPKNLYECLTVTCINFTLPCLFLLFQLALFITRFIHSLSSLFTKYLLRNEKKKRHLER